MQPPKSHNCDDLKQLNAYKREALLKMRSPNP